MLTSDEFRRLYRVVDKCGNAQHGLMLRLLSTPASPLSELVTSKIADVDLDAHKIPINDGKGGKDRYVPAANFDREWLGLVPSRTRQANATESMIA